MLVIARVIRHAVDVRLHEGQEGDAEGLQICQRLGVVLEFDKRFGMEFDSPALDTRPHDSDGMAAGADKGIELVEGIVVDSKDKLGSVAVRDGDGG